MRLILHLPVMLAITLVWILARVYYGVSRRRGDWELILVYICLVVVICFTFFFFQWRGLFSVY